MSRNILITAIKWTPEYLEALHAALQAAYKKYGSDMVVMVGYTAIGLKIATVAIEHEMSVQMFAPDLNIQPKAIDVVNGITITSSTKAEYMRYMVGEADAVMAFDKGDPVVLTATKLNKRIWFPIGEN